MVTVQQAYVQSYPQSYPRQVPGGVVTPSQAQPNIYIVQQPGVPGTDLRFIILCSSSRLTICLRRPMEVELLRLLCRWLWHLLPCLLLPLCPHWEPCSTHRLELLSHRHCLCYSLQSHLHVLYPRWNPRSASLLSSTCSATTKNPWALRHSWILPRRGLVVYVLLPPLFNLPRDAWGASPWGSKTLIVLYEKCTVQYKVIYRMYSC